MDDSLNLSVLQDSKIYKESQNVNAGADHDKNIDESDLLEISGLSMLLLEKKNEPKKATGNNYQKNLDANSQEEAWCGKGECSLI